MLVMRCGAVGRWVVARMGVMGAVALMGVGESAAASGQTAAAPVVFLAQPFDTRQEVRVTLDLQATPISKALDEIAAAARMSLSWSRSKVPLDGVVSATLHDVPVREALATVLRGTGAEATFSSDGGTIFIARAGRRGGGKASGGSVVGLVTDSVTGHGLGGATAHVQGTKLAATSSDSGQFTLRNVPPGDQLLLVRLFGYRPVTRMVTVVDGERTTVRIAMAPVPTVLSGVVTTATGQQRKVEVGNDITTLNVDSIMQIAPILSVTDLLETRVPGLTVLHSSGVPGDPARLRLRGAGSIQLNNDPVVVLDGVRVYASQSDPRNNNLAPAHTGGSGAVGGYAAPSPLDQIDPNSIETIEVFKGPSATAMYGSDAANGVIVITTKHGRAGPTHWQLALADGVNWLPGSWPVNYFRFGFDSLFDPNATGFCQWFTVHCRVDSLVAFQALNDPRYTVFAHGSDQTANLTISGGVPALQYSLSGSAAGDVGNLKLPGIERQRYETFYGPIPGWMRRPDNYQTWGVNGSLTAQPMPQARVTLQSSLFNSTQQRSSLEQAITQLNGEYINGFEFFGLFGGNPLASTPLIQNDVERATDNQLTSTNTLSLYWQPVQWLPLNATVGLNTMQRSDETYIPYGIHYDGNPYSSNGDTTGSYGLGRGTSHDQTLTIGTAVPVFRQRATLAVGGDYHSGTTADFSAYTNQLAPGVSNPTSFPTTNNASNFSQSTAGVSTYGWYVEPRVNVASRFFVAPGFRLDGGSGASRSAGSVSGLSAFPKVDFSWVAVDRSAERPLWGILTQLRPRISFGYAGTQPAPSNKLRLFNVGGYQLIIPGQGTLAQNSCQPTITLDGSTEVPAVCLNALGNTQLRPERTSQLEGGFDATLWQGRLTLTYTQYNKTRHDAILSIPVAPSVSGDGSGGTNYEKNIGVIRNTGTELTANAFVLQTRAASWKVGANLSNDNNLVVRLNPGQAPIVFGDGTRVVAGYPVFGRWAQPIVSFVDANHDGIIESSEVRLGDSAVFVGQQVPKYQMNITTDIALLSGRLGVHATFAYQNGLTQFNDGTSASRLGGSGAFALLPNTPGTSLATQAAVVEDGCVQVPGNTSLAEGCTNLGTPIGLMQTVNTFRFNDLSINYEVPKVVSAWFRVPRMTLALQGSNLGLHSNYRGKDPAVNAFSTVSAGDETKDLGQIPEPRTWWLKMTVGN